MMPNITPVLYLDIDGTVRWGKDELGKFVNTADDVKIFEEVPSLLTQYKARGWKIIGVSNQGGIGLGYLTEEACKAAMDETNRQTGGVFDDILWCPHHPQDGCACRKPNGGLIYQAQRKLEDDHMDRSFPLNKALFVGDRPEDAACARNAGIEFMDAKPWRNSNHLAGLLWDEA